jgi:hypothetical protein
MFKDILAEVFPIIQKVAPTFATALGSPGAGLATTFALSMLAKEFGVNPGDVHQLVTCISGDPDCNSKLSNIESEFSGWIKNSGLQITPPSKIEMSLKLEW